MVRRGESKGFQKLGRHLSNEATDPQPIKES